MQKKIIYLIIVIFIIVAPSGCSLFGESKNIIKINNIKIKIEIADTPELQYQGLSGRESLCENCGMLFKFNDKQERTFVMRDMNFPIDIIWIDDNIIVGINRDLQPEGLDYENYYESSGVVNYVLEVNGGFADRNGIRVGDKVVIK